MGTRLILLVFLIQKVRSKLADDRPTIYPRCRACGMRHEKSDTPCSNRLSDLADLLDDDGTESGKLTDKPNTQDTGTSVGKVSAAVLS